MEENKNQEQVEQETKKKMKPWLKIVLIIGCIILVILLGVALYANVLLDRIQYEKDNGIQDEYFEQDENTNGYNELDPSSIIWDESELIRREDDVINILLVGEEAMNDGGNRGRTDSIMIATINVKQRALKLTSLMRDLYVQIPGYSDNKLNAAYHIGGMELLMKTISVNFNIEVDGYVKVGFHAFEDVINQLGGVEITLTEKEANYLNRTNYISNPQYRNVRPGTQILNGNQALGYSRIRYVSTETEANDFGRTMRQRAVVTALFEKYKEKSALELVNLLPSILSLVTTNLTKTEIIENIYLVVTMKPDHMETLRIPVDNEYYGARIRGMSVLVADTMQDNVDVLHEFVFGTNEDSNGTQENEIENNSGSK